MKIAAYFLLIMGVAGIVACQDKTPIPKPRAYPKIHFPERTYNTYEDPACPFSFKYPAYAEIRLKEGSEICWFDLYMPAFEARLHCSYVPVTSRAEYQDLVRDAFVIAYKINERANYMEESLIRTEKGIGGLAMTWTGPAASPMHFYLTDTTSHFFKAALYFDAKVQPDSLAPIVEFVKQDVQHVIRTFVWKNEGGE